MDIVGTKFVTRHYNHGETKVRVPFLSKGEFYRISRQNETFGYLEDKLLDAIVRDRHVDKIAGDPWNGLYIRYKAKAPAGYVSVSEYACAKAGANELWYEDKGHKVLRAWWD